MYNPFDVLKNTAFAVVANTMGYEATYYPDGINGEEITSRVLFNTPDDQSEVGDYKLDPTQLTIEYRAIDFPGLKEKVEDRVSPLIKIKGMYYDVLNINADRRVSKDGDTYLAYLQLNPTHNS